MVMQFGKYVYLRNYTGVKDCNWVIAYSKEFNDEIQITHVENKFIFNMWGHLRFIKWKDFQGFIDLSSGELPFSLPGPSKWIG